MKNLSILIFLFAILILVSTKTLFSQNVGIGTINPDPSALLDISSSDKGILVPRMSTAFRVSIDSPADGLLVYDTDTGSFWFFQGAQWKNLSATHHKLEDADGNTKGMVEKNPNEDVIRFDLAGNERMRLTQNSNGDARLEMLSGNENTFIGQNAGKNSNGHSNVALGFDAFQANGSGFHNISIGRDALRNNTSGYTNVALGSEALLNNLNGNENTAVGWRAHFDNIEGRYNTALGAHALINDIGGWDNVGLGFAAGVTSGYLINAIAIGAYSKVACSHCMVLGGINDYAVKVGIGVLSPTESLHVNGNIRVDGKINQEAIINATLNTGWTNLGGQFQTAGYYKGKDGRVYLQGTIVKNAGSSNVVFSLPIGYRPAKELRFSAYRHDDLTTGIYIDSFGSVLESGAPNGSQISLDGISFRVE